MLEPVGAVRSAARLAFAGASAAIAVSTGLTSLHSEVLYFTDFESPPFLVGEDTWAGTDGWLANSIGFGVHGIDDDQYIGDDQTAFLGGFRAPEDTLVVMVKPLDHDPVTGNSERIVFDALVAIHEPTPETTLGDSFWFTIYNIDGDLLAGIRLSNELLTYGIWRYDGTHEFDTGLGFLYGQHHLFCIEVDFQNNRWRADMDGLPLFTDAPFTSKTTAPRDLGSFSYEWQLTSNNVNQHGDNWMQVVDTIMLGHYGTEALEVRVTGLRVAIAGMMVTAKGVGLPEFHDRAGQGGGFLIHHAASHLDHFPFRLPAGELGQVHV